MKRNHIPLVLLLVLTLVASGLASPLDPCNCSQPKSRAMESPNHGPSGCCEPPAPSSPADCPCGDNCNAAFQAPARDLIVSFSDTNPVSTLESGRCLSFSFGSDPSESSLAAPFASRHGLPAESIYLRTTSLRC